MIFPRVVSAIDRRIIARIIFIILFIATATAIFIFSSQPQNVSDSVSTKVSDAVSDSALKVMTPPKIGKIQIPFRKYAHMYLYALLGICAMSAALTWHTKLYYKLPAALLVCFAYAASDEFHQKFVDGRSCEWRDVGFDSIGYGAGILLVLLLWYICSKYIKLLWRK